MARDLPKYAYRKPGGIYFQRPKWRSVKLLDGEPKGPADIAEITAKVDYILAEGASRNPELSRSDARYFSAMEKGAKGRARKAGRPFSLPVGWMAAQYERQGGLCAISGLSMRRTRDKHCPYAASIDRRDPTKGYTPKNCQLVCYMVNCAKNQFTMPDFFRMCEAVVVRHGSLAWTNRERTENGA